MKRNQIIAAYSAIIGVTLNKMNEDMTDAILTDIISFSAIQEQFLMVQEELRKRTIEVIDLKRREDYNDIVTKMKALDPQKQAALQAVINDNYADILKAQNSYIKALNKWLEKDITLELDLIDRKEFIKAMKDSDQKITPADLNVMAAIFKDHPTISAKIDLNELESLIE